MTSKNCLLYISVKISILAFFLQKKEAQEKHQKSYHTKKMLYLQFSRLKSFQNFASLGSYDITEETPWGIQEESWKLQTFAETYERKCKEIQPVHPKGDQSWVFIGRTDARAETPILWPLHAKSWLIGKDPNAGRGWGQEEKGTTEDEMAGWNHWLNGRESEWTPGVGDGQGGPVCCGSWGCKKSDMTERLNWRKKVGCSLKAFY